MSGSSDPDPCALLAAATFRCMSDWISTKQAADILHVHPETLRRQVKDHKLGSIRIQPTPGGHMRLHEADVLRHALALRTEMMPVVSAPQPDAVAPVSVARPIRLRDRIAATLLFMTAGCIVGGGFASAVHPWLGTAMLIFAGLNVVGFMIAVIWFDL